MAAFTLTGVEADSLANSEQLETIQVINPGQAVTTNGVVVDPSDTLKLGIKGVAISTTTAGAKSVSIVTAGKLTVTNTLAQNTSIIAAPGGQLQLESDLIVGQTYIIVGYTLGVNTLVVAVNNTAYVKV